MVPSGLESITDALHILRVFPSKEVYALGHGFNPRINRSISIADLLKSKAIKIEGDQNAFTSFLGKIDSFNFWFNIVEP